MPKQLTKRRFVGPALAAPSKVVDLELVRHLHADDSEHNVFEILRQNLLLGAEHRELVASFTASLRHAHFQRGEHLGNLALDTSTSLDSIPTHFGSYLVQEFVGTTNYLEFTAGKAETLRFVGESAHLGGAKKL